MSDPNFDLLKNISEQLPVKEIYDDLAKPSMKSTGNLVDLLPRTINASLEKLHVWILNREYNIEMTKKLLEKNWHILILMT